MECNFEKSNMCEFLRYGNMKHNNELWLAYTVRKTKNNTDIYSLCIFLDFFSILF